MGLTADDYRNQLAALLPPGPAWDVESSADLYDLIDGLAQEFGRLHGRILTLIEEADPHTTLELLADYERVFGLPAECMADVDRTIDQRRAQLAAQMTASNAPTKAYFIALAASAGYAITITEFLSPNVWQVNAPLNSLAYHTVTGGVNEGLGIWGNQTLECLLTRNKPAHTIVNFAYT